MTVWVLLCLLGVVCVQMLCLWGLVVLKSERTHEAKEQEAASHMQEGACKEAYMQGDAALSAESIEAVQARQDAQEHHLHTLNARLARVEKQHADVFAAQTTVTAVQRTQREIHARMESTDRGLRLIKRLFEQHEHGHTRGRLS